MPELPEVETSRRGIAPHIEQQRIAAVHVYQPQLRWPVPVTDIKNLVGEKIDRVERRAKYLKIHCQSGFMLVHLGMSGNVRITDTKEPLKKHDHIDIHLESGKTLRFHDPRRFGCWLFQPYGMDEHSLLADLGPEPLSDAFNGKYLFDLSRNKKQAIKTWIMDNHVVVGVGNIYAAESLFKAGINPNTAVGKISLARFKRLADVIKETLAAAIDQGGTTLRDFLNSDGKPGYFQQTLMVYGREEQACYVCGTAIKRAIMGQRSTFYCSKCQK